MESRYRILILSLIPVVERNLSFMSIDLWVRDLEKQIEVAEVNLICPLGESEKSNNLNAQIPAQIKVSIYQTLSEQSLNHLVLAADIIQIPGNFGWKNSASARRVLRSAKRNQKKIILGVSSNRASTNLINSRGKGLLRSIIGFIRYLDVRSSQYWLARKCDGIFVIGTGVFELFKKLNKNIHIGVASWISESDILTKPKVPLQETVRLCIASRFEQMKGIHIGISAMQFLVDQPKKITLTIIGDGPEKNNLKNQVQDYNLSEVTDFIEPLDYPTSFFNMLDSMDLVILTNLGDEQPRLVFDAIARGCIPICPNTPVYRALDLDSSLLYERGNARALYEAIEPLLDLRVRENLREKILKLAQTYTIEQMHAKRAEWVRQLLID